MAAARLTGVTITILDGGMGKELRRIGAPFRQPEWSSLALIEAPDRVVEAHRNFIDAGADVIVTNNYAVVPFHHDEEFFEREGTRLVELSGVLARRAVDESDRPDVRVAGSMPPLFGSYRPDLVDPGRAAPLYRRIADALSDHVDLWVAETLCTVAEIHSIVDAIDQAEGDRHVRRPIWISITVPDDTESDGIVRLASGETIDDVIAAIDDRRESSHIEAVLVNCASAERTGPALAAIRAAVDRHGLDLALGGYANAFPDERSGGYSANEVIFERRADLTAETYADLVAGWIDDSGATLVGGCCDMYPEHIAALADRFSPRASRDAATDSSSDPR